ncbi:MAG: glycosyltransferase family 2 protein [Chloroflexota bacterium]|nr:MAG: glycosyltransferase family 2 protein [Chloroflexota bacterium]
MTRPLPISLLVLTYNEEANIGQTLSSVREWVDEIYVVDSGSTDETCRVAEQYGATVAQHAFESHTRQWDWALHTLPLANEWVLALDADLRITTELRDELTLLFTTNRHKLNSIAGIYLNRRAVFQGRWIRHGAFYPKYLLKLFRKSCVSLSPRDLLDHHFYVVGSTLTLRSDMIEENLKDLDIGFFVDRHRRYARKSAEEEFAQRIDGNDWPIKPDLLGSPDQRVVWLKRRWYRMPLYVRPLMLFLYRYVVRMGFMDGRQGFVFHFIQSLWFRMMVDIYLAEMLSARDRGGELV